MALTQATELADFTSGIGTAGAILEVDNVNNKIGIGTTNPQALLQVGQIIKMDGPSGIITATSFSGNVTGVSTGLTGTPDITVNNIVAAAATSNPFAIITTPCLAVTTPTESTLVTSS